MSAAAVGPLPHFDAPADIEFARPFWDAVQRSELVLPRCSACRRWQWYPDLAGPDCAGAVYEWVPVAPTGIVHTWTRVHRPFLPAESGGDGGSDVPHVVGFVELDGVDGVRLVANLVDDPETVRIGAHVVADFVDLGRRRHLVFRAVA